MAREDLYAEVEAGTVIAKRLKNLFFKDVPWSPKLGFAEIPKKLTYLKKTLRPFYPDKTDTQMLRIVADYTDQDILDIFCDKV